MRILITGATGFIGTVLSKMLLKKKHRIVALTRRPPQVPNRDDSVSWIQADLSQAELSLPQLGKIDAVIYLAQSRNYRNFPKETADIFNVNVTSVMRALEYARQNSAKRFVYASTANVYPASTEPISENFQISPTTFYAQTKRMAEMLVESYADFFEGVIVRLFTVYGPGQSKMLIPSLIERVRQGNSIQIQGRFGLKLSPIYVDDVCQAIQSILEARNLTGEQLQIYNLGGDQTLSIYELGQIIGDTLDITPKFEFLAEKEPGGWIADNSKIKARFDLNQFVPFSKGFQSVVKSLDELSPHDYPQ